MQCNVSITTIYKCSLERAFKTPILCDVSKIHTGYGIRPNVTHCTEGENWGKPSSSKKGFVVKCFTQNGGWASIDNCIQRIENKYWRLEIDNFQ